MGTIQNFFKIYCPSVVNVLVYDGKRDMLFFTDTFVPAVFNNQFCVFSAAKFFVFFRFSENLLAPFINFTHWSFLGLFYFILAHWDLFSSFASSVLPTVETFVFSQLNEHHKLSGYSSCMYLQTRCLILHASLPSSLLDCQVSTFVAEIYLYVVCTLLLKRLKLKPSVIAFMGCWPITSL